MAAILCRPACGKQYHFGRPSASFEKNNLVLHQTLKWGHNLTLQWHQRSIKTSQFTCLLTVCLGWHQRKSLSSASLALCEENPPVTGGFPSQRASNMESVSMSSVASRPCACANHTSFVLVTHKFWQKVTPKSCRQTGEDSGPIKHTKANSSLDWYPNITETFWKCPIRTTIL